MNVQQVREAAEWIIGEPLLFPCGSNIRKVADAYLSLADPTPLTVERLVERGGKCVGDDAIRFGELYFVICEVEGIVGVSVGKNLLPRKLWPRTVGELAMMELMMEGR